MHKIFNYQFTINVLISNYQTRLKIIFIENAGKSEDFMAGAPSRRREGDLNENWYLKIENSVVAW